MERCILYIVPQNVTAKGEEMNTTKIGEKLSALRGNRTQEEVAKAINISTSALSMYECGERIPRDTIKIAIAKYYGTTVEAIFYTNE